MYPYPTSVLSAKVSRLEKRIRHLENELGATRVIPLVQARKEVRDYLAKLHKEGITSTTSLNLYVALHLPLSQIRHVMDEMEKDGLLTEAES